MRRFDRNGDGVIDGAELRQGLQELRPPGSGGLLLPQAAQPPRQRSASPVPVVRLVPTTTTAGCASAAPRSTPAVLAAPAAYALQTSPALPAAAVPAPAAKWGGVMGPPPTLPVEPNVVAIQQPSSPLEPVGSVLDSPPRTVVMRPPRGSPTAACGGACADGSGAGSAGASGVTFIGSRDGQEPVFAAYGELSPRTLEERVRQLSRAVDENSAMLRDVQATSELQRAELSELSGDACSRRHVAAEQEEFARRLRAVEADVEGLRGQLRGVDSMVARQGGLIERHAEMCEALGERQMSYEKRLVQLDARDEIVEEVKRSVMESLRDMLEQERLTVMNLCAAPDQLESLESRLKRELADSLDECRRECADSAAPKVGLHDAEMVSKSIQNVSQALRTQERANELRLAEIEERAKLDREALVALRSRLESAERLLGDAPTAAAPLDAEILATLGQRHETLGAHYADLLNRVGLLEESLGQGRRHRDAHAAALLRRVEVLERMVLKTNADSALAARLQLSPRTLAVPRPGGAPLGQPVGPPPGRGGYPAAQPQHMQRETQVLAEPLVGKGGAVADDINVVYNLWDTVVPSIADLWTSPQELWKVELDRAQGRLHSGVSDQQRAKRGER
eukprot:TRINITY_DN3420_c0_g1_i2.p1 TRINITY_DN3420_c0_g1~~TRINITY_DN3420_c0_g1_i2.p1  ORF type:complete len:674 (-),score=136.83 TRINITY_DN3420_c0_g1_i2:396-2267(-)